jgi:hypothetical protein
MLGLSGCAALFGAKEKTFDLRSQPEGADVYLNGNRLGTTPVQARLSNLATHTFVYRKAGYKEASCTLARGTDGGWVVLDILAGIVPVIVDAATNSWTQTKGNSCMQGLEPLPGTPQTAPPRATVDMTTAPTPAPAAPEAVLTPTSTPAPASVPAGPPDTAAPTTVPPGTRFIGDARSRSYYSVDCPAADEIDSGYRFFFRSEAGAQAEGYRKGSC